MIYNVYRTKHSASDTITEIIVVVNYDIRKIIKLPIYNALKNGTCVMKLDSNNEYIQHEPIRIQHSKRKTKKTICVPLTGVWSYVNAGEVDNSLYIGTVIDEDIPKMQEWTNALEPHDRWY